MSEYLIYSSEFNSRYTKVAHSPSTADAVPLPLGGRQRLVLILLFLPRNSDTFIIPNSRKGVY